MAKRVKNLSPEEKRAYFLALRKTEDQLKRGDTIRGELAGDPQRFRDPARREIDATLGTRDDMQAANAVTDENMLNLRGTATDAYGRTVGAMAGLEGNYDDVLDPYTGLPLSAAGLDDTYARFENPYIDDVVDPVLEQMRFDQSRARSQRAAEAAQMGGISSSRAGVADALAQRLDQMNLAQTEGQLRSDAFRSAREMGLNEAGFRLQGADTVGRARAGVADARANIGMQRANQALDVGRMNLDEQGIAEGFNQGSFDRSRVWRDRQQGLGETQRAIWDQNREAKRTAQRDAESWYSSVLQGGNVAGQIFAPDAAQKKPSTGSTILGTLATGFGAYLAGISDERAKEDIKEVDDEASLEALRKTPVHGYRYKPGIGHRDDETRGLMAQDIEAAGLDGVVMEGGDGLKRVDVYSLLSHTIGAVRALDDRTRNNAGLA